MKKFLIAILLLSYFLFGHSLIFSSSQVYADCKDGSNTYPEGTQLCKDRGWFNFSEKNVIECGYDGNFFDAGVCSINGGNICAPAIAPNQGDRCLGLLAANPTPTPITAKCDGGYSWKEQRCVGTDKIEECKLQPDKTVKWVQTGTCLSSQCQSHGSAPTRTALCDFVQPTATPDPDPKCQAFDKNGAVVKIDVGSKICDNYGPTQPNSDVKECKLNNNVAELVKIGTCQGYDVCKSDPPIDIGYQCKNVLGGDAFVPVEETNPACVVEPKPAQQLIPQPGVNCGIPASQLPDGTPTTATACCYSSAADMKVMPLSCFIKLPGAEDFFNSFSDKINAVIDCLPDFRNSNCSPDKVEANVANLRKALKEVPKCMPHTTIVNEALAGKDVNGEPQCTCSEVKTNTSELCNNIKKIDENGAIIDDIDEQTACKNCMLTVDNKQGDGVWTAIGCINISSENGIIQSLFRIGIGLGGAIALLCNIYGAFLFQTSRGNPEGIKKAQDLITSCITGLLLIIFSVFILRLIGYNILRIPGFG